VDVLDLDRIVANVRNSPAVKTVFAVDLELCGREVAANLVAVGSLRFLVPNMSLVHQIFVSYLRAKKMIAVALAPPPLLILLMETGVLLAFVTPDLNSRCMKTKKFDLLKTLHSDLGNDTVTYKIPTHLSYVVCGNGVWCSLNHLPVAYANIDLFFLQLLLVLLSRIPTYDVEC
jgi:hypothetical protein